MLVAGLALVVLSGCSRDDQPQREVEPPGHALAAHRAGSAPPRASVAPPARPRPHRPYNVLLITIDALRADMPWAGYPRNIAPWLTRFEKRCTDFTQAYSLSSYTAKSVAPMLVGKYPSEMKRNGYYFTRWLPQNLFISERAEKAGDHTLSGQAHGYFLPTFGLNQGFEDYRLLPGTVLETTGVSTVTSEKLNHLAKKMLSVPRNVSQANGKRFFAYFHFLDPHWQYIVHAGDPFYGNKRRDRYDNEVHYTDRWVGNLIDWALKQPWGKHTAVIISADHGEGFGEHGQFRHGYELWQSLVRVPWFIYVPGAPPHHVDTPRSAIDMAPTIADLMGLPDDPPFRGKSLVPEVFGAKAVPRPVIVDLPRCNLMDRRRALIWKGYKLIAFGDDRRFLLYDIAHDPKEKHNLTRKQPEKFAQMKKLYQRLSKGIPEVAVVGAVPLMGVPPSKRW